MKRLLLLAVCALLVMSFAACGCSSNVTTEPTTAPTTAPTTMPTTAPTTAPTDNVTDPAGDATTLPGDNGTGKGIRGMR